MGDVPDHTDDTPFYRRRWFVVVAVVLFVLFILPALVSDAADDPVNDRLSQAQPQSEALRAELDGAERRIAELESELAQARSGGSKAEAQAKLDKRSKKLNERERKLDRRAKSLRKRARRLAAQAADIAAREADEQVALSGGSDDSGGDDSGGGGCHPSYEGDCVPVAVSDVDCTGGSGDGPAYVGTVSVVGPDQYDLDRDGDGVACDT